MPYKLGSRRLPMDVAWTHTDGRQFPANFLRLSTQAERDALGLLWEEPTATNYDQRFYWGVDNPKQLNDVTDEDGNTTTGLKTLWKTKQSEIASSLLTPSDWRVVKAAEVTGYAVTSQWLTYRAAVRTACNTRQTEIDACSDVPALKELLFGATTITRQQTDSDGNGVVQPDTITVEGEEVTNPDAGEPVMETVANPAIATAWPTLIE